MKNKNNNTENTSPKARKGVGTTAFGWLRRMFMGASKEVDAFEVEKIVSPGRKIIQEFLSRKLAVGALAIVLVIFTIVLVGPFFNPLDLSYNEISQKNTAPSQSMRKVPAALNGNCKSISTGATFSVGLSNDGDVYVWGNTKISANVDVKDIPQEVKDANILYASAGSDHIIAIDDQGKVYGWGSNDNAQYGDKGKDNAAQAFLYTYAPDVILYGKINVANVKQLVCGFQVSAIVMNDGSLYIWGNRTNGATNMKKISKLTNVQEIVFASSAAVALLKDGTIATGDYTAFDYITVNASGEVLEENDPSSAPAAEGESSRSAAPAAGASGRASVGRKQMLLSDYIGTRKVLQIAASEASMGIILDDGEVVVVGTATNGEKDVPELAAGETAISIQAGAKHYTMLTDKGTVYSWGSGLLNQTKVPAKLANGSVEVDKISANAFQSYAIDNEGNVYSWGHKGYLMGTDAFGRDIWNRILNGGRMTMTIGAVAVIISSIIGIIVGCISGYFGGWVDMLLMRVTEIFSAIPFLPFALILSAIIQQTSLGEDMRIFLIMVVLGLLSWTGLARLVRGQVLAEREKEFVVAAKAMGVKESKIAFKHILPNIISVILVTMTLDFAGCMLTESSLSYLGFGVQLPRPTWGNMLYGSNNSIVIQQYWWRWVFPALFLGICTICINIVGDTLRDVMDPKSTEK